MRVRGAREHNLRNVDVDIPRDALVVFTGVSGSGKSSLAFGTLYAEAQRRYLESVAPYARRLIDQAGTPEVDAIDGLPPAVALQQQRGTPTARSSVGSATTISSLLRLLYSRAGQYPARQPMLYAEDFSPNTPEGACPHCHGMGRVYEVTERSLVPDDRLTIRERAVAAWPTAWGGQNLRDILVMLGHDVDVPWRDLPRKTRDWILFTDEQPVVPVYAGLDRKAAQAARKAGTPPSYMGTFSSARRHVLHSFAHSQSARMRERAAAFLVGSPCPACGGKRLKPEALSVTFAGHDIAELGRLPLGELARLLQPVAEGRLGDSLRPSGGPRAPVARPGADSHRAHIARRVAAGGSALCGGAGCAPHAGPVGREGAGRPAAGAGDRRAHRRAVAAGAALPDAGPLHALAVVRRAAAPAAGHAVGLPSCSGWCMCSTSRRPGCTLPTARRCGPRCTGSNARAIRCSWWNTTWPRCGPPTGWWMWGPARACTAAKCSTAARRTGWPPCNRRGRGATCSPGRDGPAPVQRTPREAAGWLRLEGIGRHNLKGVDAAFPVGCLTAVTGVSGSGKSSLVSRALVELVAQALGSPLADAREDEESVPDGSPGGPPHAAPQDDDPGAADDPGGATSGRIAELAGIRRLVRVDQKPIGRTPRSNLATYTGLFDGVRKLFAATPAARRRRYGPGRFSFNVAAGRCPTCEGEGSVSVELLFLPSVYAPCPDCHGARYNPATLEVRWNGLDIADVLRLTVDAACEAFAREAAVLRPLALLREIGLGYLRLGQPATELSGGEAQRIKLATELQRPQRGDTLYVLDEPTTGLHPADVDRLLVQLDGLAAAGNTVVVVEHDMRVVAACDWVIDMGPGAGGDGGRIVAAGTPSEVARQAGSRTAPYLARALAGEPGA